MTINCYTIEVERLGIRKTGKGGGDLQLSYVEHAFNVNLCKHKSHSLNCSNLLVVSGLGAIGNYTVGKRKAGVSNNSGAS